MNNVRVRIAPSPSGFLHVGTARTALFNWLFAKKESGTFILRIEDTDRERSRTEFEKSIIEGLSWLGLDHDEFYRQSERASLYREHLEKLLDEHTAFYCGHSVADLETEALAQRKAHEHPRHVCEDRERGLARGIIRLKNENEEKIIINDIIRGEISYEASLFGDISLAKAPDNVLYNFAVTVDDALMQISHVIRGEDHISNTPKQILIGQALGLEEPAWAHLPLLLGKDRSKLSKRHGALDVYEYRKQGYLAGAIVNFLALLGWHPRAGERGEREKEVFSRDELIEAFELMHIQKGGAVAALEKLDWFNRKYIKMLPAEELADEIVRLVENPLPHDAYNRALPFLKTRATRLTDIDEEVREILNPPQYSGELLMSSTHSTSAKTKIILNGILESTEKHAPLKNALDPLIAIYGRGEVLWPLRIALSGKRASLGPYELAEIVGPEETQRRITKAVELL